MVKTLKDYKKSSYRYYAYGIEDELVDRDHYYEDLGNNDNKRQQRYRDIILDREAKIIDQAQAMRG